MKISQPAQVWLVEQSAEGEVYSNGLRVERDFLTAAEPRRYRRVPLEAGAPASEEWATEPAGIVFHTSESEQPFFTPEENRSLRRHAIGLLNYVRERGSYHYVIDRFGRVHRILADSERAGHAGNSVWADERWAYIGLNDSFLGICFEAQSQPEKDDHGVNPAQVHAGRILVDMLRSKYSIEAENCITHAQVSVNPSNSRIGYHTDWAANFPYPELGLPDNYEQPLPSLYAFGFEYDPLFVKSTGFRLWRGLLRAEERIRREAASQGLSPQQYRAALRREYRNRLEAMKNP